MVRIRILHDIVSGRCFIREGTILKAKMYPGTKNCKAHTGTEAVILYGNDFEILG